MSNKGSWGILSDILYRSFALLSLILKNRNAHNGEILYKERLGGGACFASPVLANGLIYFASYTGEIMIIKAGEKPEKVNQIDLDDRLELHLQL